MNIHYDNPANWGITEEMLTVLFPYNGLAIALADDGELFCSDLPAEYAVPGTVIAKNSARPVSELPEIARTDITVIADVILGRYDLN